MGVSGQSLHRGRRNNRIGGFCRDLQIALCLFLLTLITSGPKNCLARRGQHSTADPCSVGLVALAYTLAVEPSQAIAVLAQQPQNVRCFLRSHPIPQKPGDHQVQVLLMLRDGLESTLPSKFTSKHRRPIRPNYTFKAAPTHAGNFTITAYGQTRRRKIFPPPLNPLPTMPHSLGGSPRTQTVVHAVDTYEIRPRQSPAAATPHRRSSANEFFPRSAHSRLTGIAVRNCTSRPRPTCLTLCGPHATSRLALVVGRARLRTPARMPRRQGRLYDYVSTGGPARRQLHVTAIHRA